jgi:hypothetical protein
MTNRERAKAWLSDNYPSSAWEREHVAALALLLDVVAESALARGKEEEHARVVAWLLDRADVAAKPMWSLDVATTTAEALRSAAYALASIKCVA